MIPERNLSNTNSFFSCSHSAGLATVPSSHCGRGVYCIKKYTHSFGFSTAY